MRLVIADTGPINYLVLIGNIGLLPILFENVILPSAVEADLTDPDAPPAVRNWIAHPPAWLDAAWPAILAALCSAVSTALARFPQIELPTGRCATALAWAVAASPALGATGGEMRLAFDPPPSPHPIVEAVRNLLELRRYWTGSASELLDLLQPFAPCSTPKGVSQPLRNAVLTLADTGIELKFKRLHEGARVIHLRQDQGDAYCKNPPPDASPDLDPPPQPTQTEELPNQ